MLYQVFTRPELVRYFTSIWSKATLVQIVCLALTFIAPLLVVVSSGGLWQKLSTFSEQPNIHYKYQLLVVFEMASGDYVTWSTYENYNKLQMTNLRIPYVETREDDFNGDGLNDQLDFKLSMPLTDTEQVRGVQLMLIFDYILQTYSYFEMESMAYVSYSSPVAGSGLTVTSPLVLQQNQPLGNSGNQSEYNTSVISTTSVYAQSFDMATILAKYSLRNQTTWLQNNNPVWIGNRGAGQPFVIKAIVRYTTQYGIWYVSLILSTPWKPKAAKHIQYYTGFWEMIKWGWVQYVAVLLIFWFVFNRLKIFIFQHQLVQTIVVRPTNKKSL